MKWLQNTANKLSGWTADLTWLLKPGLEAHHCTLQASGKKNISHLGKKKIRDSKVPAARGHGTIARRVWLLIPAVSVNFPCSLLRFFPIAFGTCTRQRIEDRGVLRQGTWKPGLIGVLARLKQRQQYRFGTTPYPKINQPTKNTIYKSLGFANGWYSMITNIYIYFRSTLHPVTATNEGLVWDSWS